MADMSDGPQFSRSGETLGAKCDASLKTDVPEQWHDDFAALASLHRKTKSEYLRIVIGDHMYGKLESARQKVVGFGPSMEVRERDG